MTRSSGRVLCLADDLTGLAEIAGLAANRGIRGSLFISVEAYSRSEETDLTVTFVNLACRALSPKEAQHRLETFLDKAEVSENDHLYLKLDSAMRGPIGPLLQSLLSRYRSDRIPFLVANPAQNRVTQQGSVYIDGQPLAESPFREDPLHPAKHSFLPDILNQEVPLNVATDRETEKLSEPAIQVLDCESSDDLSERVEEWKTSTLAAGAAPFGLELLERWTRERPRTGPETCAIDLSRTLVAVGTRHPAGDSLAEEFRTMGGAAIRSDDVTRDAELPLLVRTPSDAGAPEKVSADLETAVVGLVERLRPQTLFVVGGETAQGILDRLELYRFRPVGYQSRTAILERGGRDPGYLLLKPGSYEEPGLLKNLFL